MKAKAIGIMIMIIGIVMIIFTSIDFKTTEKVVDIGTIQIDKEKNHPVHWSPIVGIVLIVGGIVIIAADKKRST